MVRFALTSRSLHVFVGVGITLLLAELQRIAAEERLLRSQVTGYVAHSQRTARLMPFVWEWRQAARIRLRLVASACLRISEGTMDGFCCAMARI